MATKTLHFVIALLFLLFALVQLNDPDPFLWVLIYGSVAVIAVLKIYLAQINYRPLLTTLIVILSMFALVYIPSFIEFLGSSNKSMLVGEMKAKSPWIEETREFLGLLIAIGALVYLRKGKTS